MDASMLRARDVPFIRRFEWIKMDAKGSKIRPRIERSEESTLDFEERIYMDIVDQHPWKAADRRPWTRERSYFVTHKRRADGEGERFCKFFCFEKRISFCLLVINKKSLSITSSSHLPIAPIFPQRSQKPEPPRDPKRKRLVSGVVVFTEKNSPTIGRGGFLEKMADTNVFRGDQRGVRVVQPLFRNSIPGTNPVSFHPPS